MNKIWSHFLTSFNQNKGIFCTTYNILIVYTWISFLGFCDMWNGFPPTWPSSPNNPWLLFLLKRYSIYQVMFSVISKPSLYTIPILYTIPTLPGFSSVSICWMEISSEYSLHFQVSSVTTSSVMTSLIWYHSPNNKIQTSRLLWHFFFSYPTLKKLKILPYPLLLPISHYNEFQMLKSPSEVRTQPRSLWNLDCPSSL